MKALVGKRMVATACVWLLAAAAGRGQNRPNVIFILTDDLGWGDLGVNFQNARRAAGAGDKPWEATPNLDRMAAEGAQLRDHYCPAPVCAPSRASLLTGVTQGLAWVRDNQFDKALENNHTLATVLQAAGYATIAVGKWGLQGNEKGETDPATWPAYPTKRGFDYFFGYARHKDGHEHYPKEGLYDGPKHERTNAAQPFFIYLAYDTPHAVLEYPTEAYPAGGGLKGGIQWLGTKGRMINSAEGKVDSYVDPLYAQATWRNPASGKEEPWPDIEKRYGTCVRRIDHGVGDILQTLKDLGIETNTLVIFTSDNGPADESYVPHEPIKPTFFASFGPFDGIKRDCWEGGLRVPALARWPGHIPAGKVITRPSALYDWLPTLAEAAGLPAPARADGVSLLPELTGQEGQRDRGYLYFEYFESHRTPSYEAFAPEHRGRLRRQMQMMRIGDYVGVRYDIQGQGDPFEIYNVRLDPEETNNLAAKMPELEAAMKGKTLQARLPNASAPRPYDGELVPAVVKAGVEKGVKWRSYDGPFPWVPDLEALRPTSEGTAMAPEVSSLPRRDNVGMLFAGFLRIPKDGEYEFRLRTDAGALLRIHDATVIDADFGYVSGEEASGKIRLQAGLHPFRLFYARRKKGAPMLELKWSGPGMAPEKIPASAYCQGAE